MIEWIFLYLSIISGLAFLQGDTTLQLRYLTPIFVAIQYVLLALSVILLGCLRKHLNFKYIWLPIVIWLVYFMSSLDGKLYFGLLNLITLCVFCILPENIKVNIYKKYRLWIIIMSFLGILAYVSFIFSLGIPYTIAEYYAFWSNVYYIDYLFSHIYIGELEVRLCGLFNEPGYLGTITALILIIEDCNIKKIGNIIMLIAGSLTFSLAFYLLLSIYFLMRMIRSVSMVIITVCVFPLLFNYIHNTQFEDSQVQYLVNRFKFDKSTGELAGDNRTSYDFELAYQRMIYEGDLLFGKGHSAMDGKKFSSSSYKSLIFKYGVVGFFIIVGGLFLASYPLAKRNREALIFLLCYFISIYQRPNVYTMVYFCLLFGGLTYIKNKIHENRDTLISKHQ